MFKQSLLYVEDNPDDEELMIRALRKTGTKCEIRIARDGAEALDAIFTDRVNRTLPDLILLDYKLPKVDGVEVIRRLRSDPRTRFIPAIVLSSSASPECILAAYEAGANSYLCKPMGIAAIENLAATFTAYWLELNWRYRAIS